MKSRKGIGIKTSVIISTVIFMGILTTAIASIGYKLYYDSVMESYVGYADTVLEYAYRKSVEFSFGDMIADRTMPENYEDFRAELNEIKDSSDIEYLYAVYFDNIKDIHSLYYAINAKSKEELSVDKPLSEIYTFMGRPVEEGGFSGDTLLILQKAIEDKKEDTGTLTGYSDVYGHMLNGYHVLFDQHGDAVGLLCVEIDINRINIGLHRYVRTVLLTATILTILMVLLFVHYVQQYLTGPVMRIIKSSTSFVEDMECGTDPENLVYADTKVSPRGDIGMLAANVKSLADGVTSYMINLRDATAEKERIGAELNVATQIQANMLPKIFPPYAEREEFILAASMNPAKEVGGDFYDFFFVDESRLALVVADVSGKGVPAALFMVIAKTLIKNRAIGGGGPAETLTEVNNQLCEGNEAELFVTVWLAIVDINTGKGLAANAGHEHPVLKRADGQFELIEYRHSPVVAAMEGIRFKEHEFELHPGDTLIEYSDGVTEATNKDNELFGNDRLLAALNKAPDASPEELLQNLRKDIDEFVGTAPQFDDITMLGMRFYGK